MHAAYEEAIICFINKRSTRRCVTIKVGSVTLNNFSMPWLTEYRISLTSAICM